MRSFLPFAALLGVALLLGCQDLGSGPVGPDGLVPQFTHKNSEHGNRGGKDDDDGTTIFEVTFPRVDHFSPEAPPTLTTKCETTVNHKLWATIFDDCMVAIKLTQPDGSTIELIRVSVFPRVKAGKVTAIDMYFNDDNLPGSGTTYGTGLLLPDEVEGLENGGFIVHMHVDEVELKERKNSPSIGKVSIGDAVYTLVPAS